jgi:hypothetical protein
VYFEIVPDTLLLLGSDRSPQEMCT